MSTNEDALINRLGVLFETTVPKMILVLARRYNIDKQDAEDAIHDVFASLIRRARHGGVIPISVAPTKSFDNYVLRGALNRIIDHARMWSRQRSNVETLIAELTSDSSASPNTDATMEIEKIERKENIAKLLKAIDSLAPPYREILNLLLVENLTLAEIARRLNMNPRTIYVKYRRGIDRLRIALKR